METQYNFEEIWKQKKANVPDVSEIKTKANIYRRKQWFTSVFLTLILLSDIGVFIWIWCEINLSYISKLGLIIVSVALAFYIFFNFQRMGILKKINPSQNHQEYLQQMKNLQKKDLYMQTKGMAIYFVLLSVGVAIYLFGLVKNRDWLWSAVIYVVTFGWILFGWFYIRPRRIRKGQKKISEVIQSLEKIEEDFKN